MKYKFIKDLTSDVMFEAYGKTEKELFKNSAEALMGVICNIKKVKPKESRNVGIKAKDMKELMFKWLQELIVMVDIEEMFFSKFIIEKISESMIKARIYGESISKEKGKTLVKAVTYYKFDVSRDKRGYKTRVVIDV